MADLVRSRIIGSAALKAVLLAIARRANDDGSAPSATAADLGMEMEISRSTAFRAIRFLKARGIVQAHQGGHLINLETLSRLPEVRRNDH